ncbi:MAG: DEAD/DEAH box helicase, partial [Firmicutes bacterium]|nr:DEAD/DEAH box helicase [Bacillota bacterium]
MFQVEEIEDVMSHTLFRDDFSLVQRALIELRKGELLEFTDLMVSRLDYFVECVLASSVLWEGKGKLVCEAAAQVAEFLSICSSLDIHERAHMRFRSSMLYEIAQKPVLSASTINDTDLKGLIVALFKRRGPFGTFRDSLDLGESVSAHEDCTVAELSLLEDAMKFARFAHGLLAESEISAFTSITMGKLASSFSIGLSATEMQAFSYILKKRLKLATRVFAKDSLLDKLQMTNFPVELWPSQIEAIEGGLLDTQMNAWGLAAPTGTGKTSLTRLLILKTLEASVDSKIIYIVPSKALVHEVKNSMSEFLSDLQIGVLAISPQLVELDNDERGHLDDVSVIVLTPEKADLLLRLGETFFEHTSLVIIDEAHHIESGTRGLLLEMYLWRLKQIVSSGSRFIFLSAVTPNIGDITKWMGTNSGEVTINERSTRMRVGVYRVEKTGGSKSGWIYYSDNMKICAIRENASSTINKGIVQLAEAEAVRGPVLVVASGKKTCEKLAKEMLNLLKDLRKENILSEDEQNSPPIQRLDSRLEREMYSTVGMREFLKYRIAYHHAGLPPRVRVAVEDAIREKKIDFVFATTTLAEGVNFPFSTVIVQSLVLRDPPEKGKPASWQ